jgi:hypothetical protein
VPLPAPVTETEAQKSEGKPVDIRVKLQPSERQSGAEADEKGKATETKLAEEQQPRLDGVALEPDEVKKRNPEASPTAPKTADSTRTSFPSIVEPTGTTVDSHAKRDVEAHSPPPRSPSAVADEEATLGSPPASSQELPPEKQRRSSVAEEPEAEDRLLDAAWDGDVEKAQEALRHVSPACCDLRGLTPLHLAAERDNLAVAMLLLDRGASINAQSDGGRTALHLAARSATAPTVEMLLERGKADPNAQTAKGRTSLHYAASKAEDGDQERRDVIRVLRDYGADPTVVDREGETARDVAQKRGHWDAAATLKRAERSWEEGHKQNWLQRHGLLR